MRWASLMTAYYGRPFSRYQYFALRGIDKDEYERDIPARYEQDQSTDKDGMAIMPFMDLIKHENFTPKEFDKTLEEMIPEKLLTQRFTKYLKTIGYNLELDCPVSKTFDDLRIYDLIYFKGTVGALKTWNGMLEVNEAGIELRSNRYYPAGKEVKYTIGAYLNDETTFTWG